MNKSLLIAKKLIEIGAIKFNFDSRFTWASGIKSPIYCDNRKIISNVELREIVANEMVNEIRAHYPQTQVIAGTATAGIPHAAWISQLLKLPMIYIRSKSKEHGTSQFIEGDIFLGAKTLIIEDLISTGGSSIDACQKVTSQKMQAIGVLSIFSYQLKKAKINFESNNIPYTSLTGRDFLLDICKQESILNAKQLNELANFFAELDHGHKQISTKVEV